MSSFLKWFVGLSLGLGCVPALADDVISVSFTSARCLAENIAAFEDYEDPIIIVLSSCKDRPAETKEYLAAVKAAGAGLASPREGSGLSDALIITKSRLRCIAATAEGADPDTIVDDILEVDFTNC